MPMNILGIDFQLQRADPGTSDKWYAPILELLATNSGASVTPEKAMRLTAVNCAVRILSEGVASLPIQLFKRNDTGRERDLGHFLVDAPIRHPNAWQTPFDFKEMMTIHLLLRGNAYAQIVPTKEGRISQLIPLHPDSIEVKSTRKKTIQYIYTRSDGTKRTFQAWQIFHLRNMPKDGLVGISPIQSCREALGLSLSAEEYGSRFYKNDSTPGGVLTHPGRVDDDVHARLKKSWQEAHSGVKNAHNVAILEEGMDWKPISISAKDAQFIESRNFQISEIARIFNLPPHLLKDLTHATFSNIEKQDLDFLKHSLRPWLIRWEESYQRDIIDLFDGEVLPGTYEPLRYIKFNVDAITRADIAVRTKAYSDGIRSGWLSINDVRAKEDMNPIKGGDIHLAPLNMIPLSQIESFYGEQAGSQKSAISGVVADAFSRVIRKEQKEIERVQKQEKSISRWSQEFYPRNEKIFIETLRAGVVAYCMLRNLPVDYLGVTDFLQDYAKIYSSKCINSSRLLSVRVLDPTLPFRETKELLEKIDQQFTIKDKENDDTSET